MNKESNRISGLLGRFLNACGRAGQKLWKRTRHNFLLKILSVIFAVILCNVIMTQSNPERRLMINDVEVTVNGLDTLENHGLTLSPDSRANLARTVNVTLGVPMQETARATRDQITARVNLASITETGEHEVNVQVTSSLGTVYGQSLSRLKVTVEPLVSKTVPVKLVMAGTLPEGYLSDSQSLSPNVVTVRGPESLVKQIYKAQVVMNATTMTTPVSGSQEFELVNKENDVVKKEGIEISAAGIITEINIKERVSLPVNAQDSILGADRLPTGYELEGIQVLPDTVEAVGLAASLAGVNEVRCEPIDITGMTEDCTFRVTLQSVPGLYLSNSMVDVAVRIRQRTLTRTFEEVPVRILNIAPELRLADESRSWTVTVTVTGPEATVSRMSVQDLDAVLNAKGMEAGTHQGKVQLTLGDADAILAESGEIAMEPGQLEITLEADPETGLETVNDPIE